MPFDIPTETISFDRLGIAEFDAELMLVIAGRLAIAAFLGAWIAYRPWRRFLRWHYEPTESGAQTLISVAGALMTCVIGSAGALAPALAFALVGLGGFIRFRSGIKDPREAGVMFFMIGIGMAAGIGMIPVALVATAAGTVLLATLDYAARFHTRMARRRIRFSDIKQPRKLEPVIRDALGAVANVRGSRVAPRRDEIVIDIFGDKLSSAGEVIDTLSKVGIELDGDVACEEM